MDDLVVFVNRADLDPVTQAALAHAQLEVIYPYADGNGRVGRVLIGWVLTRRLMLVSPPPVSARIAVDRGGYLSGLTLFRLGQPDPWIRWFADVVRAAGQATTNLIRAVADLQTSWDVRLTGVRAGAAARRVLAVLPQYPVLDAATLAHALGVSERASRTALNTLAGHQIGRPSTRTAARSAGPANGGSPKNSSTSSPPGHADSARPRPRSPTRPRPGCPTGEPRMYPGAGRHVSAAVRHRSRARIGYRLPTVWNATVDAFPAPRSGTSQTEHQVRWAPPARVGHHGAAGNRVSWLRWGSPADITSPRWCGSPLAWRTARMARARPAGPRMSAWPRCRGPP